MINIDGLNVTELLTLRTQIDERLVEVRAELQQQLTALGGTEGKGKSNSSHLKGTKVPPKYRDKAGNTWAGRGAKPRWLTAAIKKGKKLESFLIK